MKFTLGALSAVLLAGTIYCGPAQAQPAPQGSYLDSCSHVRMHGDRLVADCRRRDGGWQRTVLDVSRCGGEIANLNGNLSCAGGPSGRYGWREGYGSSQPEDWRAERRVQCSTIVDPYERERCWRYR
jgi:hypothetical protein